MATKNITALKSCTGLQMKGANYSKQSGDFFVGTTTEKATGRGTLQFSFSSIPTGATIDSVKLVLTSITNHNDTNFGGKCKAYINVNLDVYDNSATWLHLANGESFSIDMSKPNTTNLAYLKAAVENVIARKRQYLLISIINTEEANKVVRFNYEDCYLAVDYTSENGGSGGGSTNPPGGTEDMVPVSMGITCSNITTNSCLIKWEKPIFAAAKVAYFNIVTLSNNQRTTLKSNWQDTQYQIIGLSAATTYKIMVVGVTQTFKVMDTVEFKTASLPTLPSRPNAPQKVRAEITDQSWAANNGCFLICDDIDPNPPVTDYVGYILKFPYDGTYTQRYEGAGTVWSLQKNKLIIKGLKYDQTYHLGMSAKNSVGESNWTVVQVTTPKQTTTPDPNPKPNPDPGIIPTPFVKVTYVPTLRYLILSWSYDGPKVDYFEVKQLMTDPTTYTTTSQGMMLKDLTSGRLYSWSVRAHIGSKTSEYGSNGIQIP